MYTVHCASLDGTGLADNARVSGQERLLLNSEGRNERLRPR